MHQSESRCCKASKVHGLQQNFSFIKPLYYLLTEKEEKDSQTHEQDRRQKLDRPCMLFCYKCHLLRSYSEKDRHKNGHQRYNEHDVVENEIKKGMDPQFGDGHDISDRGKVYLPGADHLSTSNDESESECTQETRSF